MRRSIRNRRGFMTMEILAALTVFSIAMAGLVPLLAMSIRGADHAKRTTTAVTIAQDQLEALRNTAYAAVASGSDSVSDDSGTTYTRTWTVVAGPATNTKSVTVTVDWTALNAHQVTLQTILAG